jgi:hypothetical protein
MKGSQPDRCWLQFGDLLGAESAKALQTIGPAPSLEFVKGAELGKLSCDHEFPGPGVRETGRGTKVICGLASFDTQTSL